MDCHVLLIIRSFLYGPLVTVVVGPEEHSFGLHKGLLSKSCDFFKAAFNGKFKERNGTLALPEQDTATFKYFVHWLYTGDLRGYFYPPTTKPSVKELEYAADADLVEQRYEVIWQLELTNRKSLAFNLANYRDLHFHSLIQLFILADALQVRGLKDPIITALIEVYGYILPGTVDGHNGTTLLFWSDEFDRPDWIPPAAQSINLAWENLPRQSPLRRVLVLLFVDNVYSATFCKEEFCSNFLSCCFDVLFRRWTADRFDNIPSRPNIYQKLTSTTFVPGLFSKSAQLASCKGSKILTNTVAPRIAPITNLRSKNIKTSGEKLPDYRFEPFYARQKLRT